MTPFGITFDFEPALVAPTPPEGVAASHPIGRAILALSLVACGLVLLARRLAITK